MSKSNQIPKRYYNLGQKFTLTDLSNFHIDLINCIKKLGYPDSSAGVCHGFTIRWIESVLTKTTDKFSERLKVILELNKLLKTGNTIELLIKNKTISNECLFDIKAFFESVLLYQNINLSSKVLKKHINQNDIEEVSAIASSDKMQYIGGFKKTAPIYLGNFEKEEITSHLQMLQEKIQAAEYKNEVSFLLYLMKPDGSLHSASLIFDPSVNGWQFIDINNLSQHMLKLNVEDLVPKLPMQTYTTFLILAVLPDVLDISKLKNNIDQIPILTTELTNAEYLLGHASREGIIAAVKILLSKDGLEFNKSITYGATSLFMAAQNGHVDAVIELLSQDRIQFNKANICGATPLFIAAQNFHTDVVKVLLAKDGIDINKAMNNGATPLFIAAQDGHVGVVIEFIKNKSIDITKTCKSTEESLQRFARNKITQNCDVIKRMDDFIASVKETKQENLPARIEVTPEQIAFIMGNADVLEVLRESSNTFNMRL